MKNFLFLSIGLLVTIAAVVQNVGISTSTHNAKLNVNSTHKLAEGSQGASKICTNVTTDLVSWQPLLPPPGTDGPKVIIGSQTWMTKNLDVITYRNGDPIPLVTNNAKWAALTTGAYCYYNNDGKNYNASGKLYNWYAVNDQRGLAPKGWHIPTEVEWTTLGDFLIGNTGGKMKEIGTTHWNTPNTGATNHSGFTGLPGGCRNESGAFSGIGNDGYWWSSTKEIYSDYARFRELYYNQDVLFGYYQFKRSGFSVRCIKD